MKDDQYDITAMNVHSISLQFMIFPCFFVDDGILFWNSTDIQPG